MKVPTPEVMMSVIIPSCERPDQIRDLMSSIERQICDLSFEVLVVAQLPEPHLRKTVESFGPRFRYLETGRLGVGTARNKGLERARGDIILFLEDDCYLLDRHFFRRHFDLHFQNPSFAGIGGRFSPPPGASRTAAAFLWIMDCELSNMRINNPDTSFLNEGNSSFKKIFLRTMPQPPGASALTGTSVDLCARLIRDGAKLMLVDDLIVEHRRSPTFYEFLRSSFQSGWISETKNHLGLAASLKHWNHLLNRDELLRAKGVEPAQFHWLFKLHERFFLFGQEFFQADPQEAASVPELSLKSYFKISLATALKHGLREALSRASLLISRALAITRYLD
jgi:glycosyltransferase involved in cell wall biosynthesis